MYNKGWISLAKSQSCTMDYVCCHRKIHIPYRFSRMIDDNGFIGKYYIIMLHECPWKPIHSDFDLDSKPYLSLHAVVVTKRKHPNLSEVQWNEMANRRQLLTLSLDGMQSLSQMEANKMCSSDAENWIDSRTCTRDTKCCQIICGYTSQRLAFFYESFYVTSCLHQVATFDFFCFNLIVASTKFVWSSSASYLSGWIPVIQNVFV